eukprot:m.49951 g.49951  ORF g.49951 m.49951 type:complete len:448 (+) comp10641_c0_seq1:128-1471(+)
MISQLFILTPRGDTVVAKDYRGDCPRGTSDIFFRKLRSYGGDPPPIFSIETVHFIHIKRNGLYFVCTTKFNIAPTMALELLTRLSNLCKDYCGVLTEESIRLNFVLIYEILDEAIDFGYGQTTTTEELKQFIYNDSVAVEGTTTDTQGFSRLSSDDGFGKRKQKKSVPSSAPNKPISRRLTGERDRKNEIFIDLLERLTVLFDTNGNVLRSEIDGCIQMKSFLQGLPELRVGLNEDLVVGKQPGMGSVICVDDCNFHECVNLGEFEHDRTLVLRPPDGEFTLMNYRISGNTQHALPFRVVLSFEDTRGYGSTDVIVRLDCDIPSKSHGSNITVRVPLPKSVSSCAYELGAPGQQVEYKKDEKVAIWKLNKVSGGLSYYCKLKVMTSEEDKKNVSMEVGPVSLDFEVPMYVCSGLAIRFLRVLERGRNYVPFRWVRYITHSDSYVFRI